MKQYGRKQFHHNHEDNHPKKGYVNWWEAEMETKSKKRARQEARKETDIGKVTCSACGERFFNIDGCPNGCRAELIVPIQ